ncbi:MAG TPA: hypothetical protein DHV21_03555 [Curvibacter sp.]|nr:hypothetical protein [Curvibacter sp.]
MERYKNLSGDSNVHSFELAPDSITVRFNDDHVYLYTSQSAGAANIAQMHQLGRAGRGLNSFINRVVRKLYAKKSRY